MSEIDPRHKHPLHEASHTVGVKEPPKAGNGKVRTGKRPGEKQIFNEASHKLGYWGPEAPSDKEEDAEAVRLRFEALEDTRRDVITDASKAVLALGALGVVYGDIGTSPLYTEQVIFTTHRAAAHATTAGVYGVVSLIFWALTIIVSIKYAGFIMRAHNRGDGGIMALASLLQRHKATRVATLVTLGIFGAALFFGDGIITPAISVLGSVQGLKVIEPQLAHLVLPISVVILLALFFIQRRGSGAIGWLFGPVILVWFIAIGLLGLNQVLKDPAVFQALSPTWGARFLADHGAAGFLTLGGVVLAVTGAETLYADRGHFGAGPIRLGWFAVAFPALMLNYLGQGVLIRDDPSTAVNPFFLMVPDWAQYPMLLPRNRGDNHRLPGRDLGFVLGCPTGSPARVPTTPHRSAPLEDRGADLRSDRQLGALYRGDHAGADLPVRRQARRHLRGRGHRNVHPQHGALRGRRPAALGNSRCAGSSRSWSCS